jgi:hypothetical protein
MLFTKRIEWGASSPFYRPAEHQGTGLLKDLSPENELADRSQHRGFGPTLSPSRGQSTQSANDSPPTPFMDDLAS